MHASLVCSRPYCMALCPWFCIIGSIAGLPNDKVPPAQPAPSLLPLHTLSSRLLGRTCGSHTWRSICTGPHTSSHSWPSPACELLACCCACRSRVRVHASSNQLQQRCSAQYGAVPTHLCASCRLPSGSKPCPPWPAFLTHTLRTPFVSDRLLLARTLLSSAMMILYSFQSGRARLGASR